MEPPNQKQILITAHMTPNRRCRRPSRRRKPFALCTTRKLASENRVDYPELRFCLSREHGEVRQAAGYVLANNTP